MVHKLVIGLGLFYVVFGTNIIFTTSPCIGPVKYVKRYETELDRILREHKDNKK